MKLQETVKIFLLGMAVAFLGMIALRGTSSVAAQDPSSGGLQAIASAGGDTAHLFLVNPTTQIFAYYCARSGRVQLQGTRYYGFDLGIYDARPNLTIKEAKNQYEKDIKAKPGD